MTESVAEQPPLAGATQAAAAAELRSKTARGAFYSTAAQGITFALRMGSTIILARLLLPADFGLVGMVTAVTGFIGLFRDAGLSMATVQRATITQTQLSNLFWINLVIGAALTLITAAAGPLLVAFYNEPRLFWVTAAFSVGFLFNGAAAQHRAVLQRDLRFRSIVGIEIVALVLTLLIALGAALAGAGYWAIVLSNVCLPVMSAAGFWLSAKWVPSMPRRGGDMRSMLCYGGTVTVNAVVVYIAYNVEKVLLGRFWGAEALGIYGRAYHLVNLPAENLNSSIGAVAFPALARLQNEPDRLRSYFLKGYTLFLSLVVPITAACALFAENIVQVFLGPKWTEAVPVFRLLTPTILAFALINPFAWLMLATGQVMRSLKIAFMIAPLTIIGYVVGMRYGPEGVAVGFSTAMLLVVVPMITWARRGTLIKGLDALKAAAVPGLSAAVAIATWLIFHAALPFRAPAFLQLVVDSTVLFGTYGVFLLCVMKQRPLYLDLLRDLRSRRS